MQIRHAVFIILLIYNSFLASSQTITDTIFVKHPDVAFHKYDSLADILFVTNLEFNSETKHWTYVLDIYGETQLIKGYNEEWFARYKTSFKYKNNVFQYLKENPYKKQIINGEWIKGETVKNGYWIQYDSDYYGVMREVCQGFIVNGMREGDWLEYENGTEIKEGDYIHDIKNGIWHERRKEKQIGLQQGSSWKNSEITGHYKNGLKQGAWIEYSNPKWIYPSSKFKQWISARMFYVNDTLEGQYIKWEIYHKKYVLEEGNYIHGLRDGEWFVFDEEHMLENSFWKNGVPGKTIIYERGLDELTHQMIIYRPYEVIITQWDFQDDLRLGYWYYETVKPINENSDVYYRWEGLYGITYGTGYEYRRLK